MSSSPARDERGRLKSNFARAHIPRAVAEVCSYANAGDPQSVSRRRFDDSREKAGWGNLPTAKSLAARMETTWEELKAASLNPEGSVTRRAPRAVPAMTVTVDQVAPLLRMIRQRVARKGGRDPEEVSLSADLYNREVLDLRLETDVLPLGQQITLPDSGTLERLAEKPFPELCKQAGVAYGVRMARGMGRVDALDLCVDAHGTLPTQKEFLRFVAANEIAVHGARDDGYGRDIAALRARRDSEGKQTPWKPPPAHQRPDYDERVIESDGHVRRRQVAGEVTEESLLADAGRFLDWLEGPTAPRGALPTTAMWDVWAHRQREAGRRAPWLSMVSKGYPTGFQGLIKDAYDRRLPEHLRVEQPEASDLLRNGPVPGDETFDYDRPLIDCLRGYRTRLFLPILTYVHQHGPASRSEIGEATGMSPLSRVQNINRLVNLGALAAVPPQPGDQGRGIRERLALGPAVVGEALRLVEIQPAVEKAKSRPTPQPQQWRNDANARALSLIVRLADREGVFYGSDFHEQLGVSRTAAYTRLGILAENGLISREEIAPDERRTTERYRYHLLPAGRAAAEADGAA